jgi:hypothetical protein
MLEPKHRQDFLDVRRITVERCPPLPLSAVRKHKDILRLQKPHALQPRSRNIQTRNAARPKKASKLAEVESDDLGTEAGSERAGMLESQIYSRNSSGLKQSIDNALQVLEYADQDGLKTEAGSIRLNG